MPIETLRLEKQLNIDGTFTLQVPAGSEIINVDDLGFLALKPPGAVPDVTRTFEVVLPGSDLTDADRGRYKYLGSVGDYQIFEKV